MSGPGAVGDAALVAVGLASPILLVLAIAAIAGIARTTGAAIVDALAKGAAAAGRGVPTRRRTDRHDDGRRS